MNHGRSDSAIGLVFVCVFACAVLLAIMYLGKQASDGYVENYVSDEPSVAVNSNGE